MLRHLAAGAAGLLNAALFIPLALTVYDILLVPLVAKIRQSESSSPLQIACDLLVAGAVMPLTVANHFFEFNGDVADMVGEYGDAASEVTTTALEVAEEEHDQET